ncbi:response regulator [Nitrospira sp. Nam74]
MSHPTARILIVDDDPVLLQALTSTVVLRMKSLVVDAVESPTAALQYVRDINYDAIISDVKMPEMDGWALLHEIRKIRSRVPVILMSGHLNISGVMDQRDAYALLQKPLDRPHLVDTLRRAIGEYALKNRRIALGEVRTRFRHVTEQHKHMVEGDRLVLTKRQQAVIATEPDGTIIYWNRTAEALYGWTAQEALGHNILQVTPTKQSLDEGRKIMDQLCRGGSWSGQFAVQKKDGTEFVAVVNDHPLYDQEGRLIAIVGVSSKDR